MNTHYHNGAAITFALGLCVLLMNSCGSLISELGRIQEKNSAGKTPATGQSCTAAPQPGIVAAVYPTAANWLSYVKNDGLTMFTATGTACTGGEGGHYNSCLHGGELRRVPVTNRTSCNGLGATDALSAFNWTCTMIGTVPNMVSGGLADEKFLSDLIDFSGTGSWRPNSVTVTDACGATTTATTVWYTNSIVRDFTSAAATLSLAGADTVYIFTTDPAKALNLAANKTAVVGQPGLVMTSNVASAHIAMWGTFQWFEGTLNSANATTNSVELTGGKFNVLRGANLSKRNLGVNNTYSCRITYLRLFDAMVYLYANSENNQFHELSLSNGRIYPDGNSVFNNIHTGLTLHSSDYGYATGNTLTTGGNIVINHTGANLSTDGLRGNPFNDSTFMNVVYVNITGTAYTPGGNRNTMINLATTNSDAGIRGDSPNDFYSGQLRIGNNTTNCYGSTGAAGISNACAPLGASDFTLTTGLNLSSAFAGKVLTDDAANTQDVSGSAAYASITDFFRFENRFRSWGRENAAAQFSINHRGFCNAGNCRIWDMRLVAADSQIRGVLPVPTGNDFYIHRWQAASAGACNAMLGAGWQDTVCSLPGYTTSGACVAAGGTWQTNLCSARALRNAYEVLNDGRGNDNGLCEAGEACIYTPNIGAYQGHGSIVPMNVTTTGMVSGVELWRYAQNGI